MKNKLIIALIFLFSLVIVGCSNANTKAIYIYSEDTVVIQQSIELKVYDQNNNNISPRNLEWTLSDYSIASIDNGKLYGKDYGKVIVGVIDKTNPNNYCSKEIEIIPPYVLDILITGKNELYIDKNTTLQAEVVPSLIKSELIWESSNDEVIIVDEGDVYAVGVGTAEVIVTCDNFEKRFEITVLPTPTSIEIYGNTNITINDISMLTFNIEEEVKLTSSNENIVSVVDNTIVGMNEGTAIIEAVKVEDPSVKGTIEVVVSKTGDIDDEMTQEEKLKIESIINAMSIKQMVGEMFNVGLYVYNPGWGGQVEIEPSTGLPYAAFGSSTSHRSFIDFVDDYNFGNFTIYSNVGKSRDNLKLAVNTLNELGKKNTGVYPFITLNTIGGWLMEGLNFLPTNVALSNASVNTIYDVNDAYSKELKAMGINTILNSYLYTNSEFGSELAVYGKDISKAMVTAKTTSDAFKTNGVIMIPAVSGAYGYHFDQRTIEELKESDLKLLESAVHNGSQMICLPCHPYVNLDLEYYNTLRTEYNYNGVIMIEDSLVNSWMYDDNRTEYLVNYINSGADMINFDFNFSVNRWSGPEYEKEANTLLALYQSIIDAVNNGKITQERIEEAVTRILLVKLRNNVLDGYEEDEDFNFNKIEYQISKHAHEFISYIGNEPYIDKDEKVLVVSEAPDYTGTTYSLGDNLRTFFKDNRGYSNIDIYHRATLYPETLVANAKDYSKIYICVSELNANTTVGFGANKILYLDFINQMVNSNANVYIIATYNTKPVSQLPNIKNFILLYDYFENDFNSLFKGLNKEVQLSKLNQ